MKETLINCGKVWYSKFVKNSFLIKNLNEKKFLVVGLGNPEGKYFQTYHNVGFLCVDALSKEFGVEFKKKGNQCIATCHLANTDKLKNAESFFLLKPLTYMNRSGEAVVAVARKYKIAPEKIIVIADDLYINKGNIRIALGGSHAGHNGIRSINELLGTNQYIKIKIGIAPEKPPHSMSDYVLNRIDQTSRPSIDEAIDKAVSAVLGIINGETIEKMQSLYNVKNASPVVVTGGDE